MGIVVADAQFFGDAHVVQQVPPIGRLSQIQRGWRFWWPLAVVIHPRRHAAAAQHERKDH
jgi:hypothetical protein